MKSSITIEAKRQKKTNRTGNDFTVARTGEKVTGIALFSRPYVQQTAKRRVAREFKRRLPKVAGLGNLQCRMRRSAVSSSFSDVGRQENQLSNQPGSSWEGSSSLEQTFSQLGHSQALGSQTTRVRSSLSPFEILRFLFRQPIARHHSIGA